MKHLRNLLLNLGIRNHEVCPTFDDFSKADRIAIFEEWAKDITPQEAEDLIELTHKTYDDFQVMWQLFLASGRSMGLQAVRLQIIEALTKRPALINDAIERVHWVERQNADLKVLGL